MPTRPCATAIVAVSLAAACLAAPAAGAPARSRRLQIPAGRLETALDDLAGQAGIQLLFAPSLIGDRQSLGLHGRVPTKAALARLLAGTGLDFSQTPDGAFVIFARPAPVAPPDDYAVPEILIAGRRSQDADIRRTRDDIQPYRVQTGREIEDAHAGVVDSFLRTRLPSNAQALSPAQDPFEERGSVRSEIDLHGLGAAQTLILIDGRRLPGLPTTGDDILQPDLNGVPLSAIDRIETLTSTAGGIYGPGATGGVVNVILKRDYRGADLDLIYGDTQRGDAYARRINARIGFTPDHGRTDVSLSFSRSISGPLRAGDRDYEVEARARRLANDPADYLAGVQASNAIIVQSFGANLVLKPAYGGGDLGSTISVLPLDHGVDAASLAAVLRANAGQVPIELSPDSGGEGASLVSRPTSHAILFNVRHRFSDAVEGFVDVIDLHDDGRATSIGASQTVFLDAGAAGNPFANPVAVIFPLPGFARSIATTGDTGRVTVGAIAALPRGWRSNVDVSQGWARLDTREAGDSLASSPLFGGARRAGYPTPDPLRDWAAFLAATDLYRVPAQLHIPRRNSLTDASLRLAGPVMTLPGGPLILSLLAEDRREVIAASTETLLNWNSPGVVSVELPRIRQAVLSLYGEMRAPLVPETSQVSWLRGLEFQLAARHDRNATTLPADFYADAVNRSFVQARQTATTYTAGFRVKPVRGLMLRSSLATGVLPPSVSQLGTNSDTFDGSNTPDPKRGGRLLGDEGAFSVVGGGSTALRPEHARSLSVGMVVEPVGARGARLSIDYARIDKSREISSAYGYNLRYFLANEAAYPGRVTRAPLSPQDAALGFTGGVVTAIDTTRLNIGATRVETVDMDVDYLIQTARAGGFRLHGAATWQPVFRRRTSPDKPWSDLVGYVDGPLEWRGNGGVQWQGERLSVGLDAQYYGHYRVSPSSLAVNPADAITAQGSAWIPAQVYVDLSAAWRLDLVARRGTPRSMTVRVGVQDLFDKSPPIIANGLSQPYSPYGDPRGRRFEITLASRF